MISLIGFTGAGKSSLGRVLAMRYGFLLWDLDHMIERKENMSIAEIFAEKGESYFREVEGNILKNIVSQGFSNSVLVTGGGAVLREQSRALLISRSFVIHLHADFKVIVQRLLHDKSRPLLQGGDMESTLAQLHAKREHAYEFAHLTVDSRDLEEAAAKIVGGWYEFNRRSQILI
ncbi:shikimate kinase [Sulfoacidibacillus thermotolerans]|nr:shikimate kinase [Sulfoacidibacillus thermotolerans]